MLRCQVNKQTNKQASKQTNKQPTKQASKQTNKHTNEQTKRSNVGRGGCLEKQSEKTQRLFGAKVVARVSRAKALTASRNNGCTGFRSCRPLPVSAPLSDFTSSCLQFPRELLNHTIFPKCHAGRAKQSQLSSLPLGPSLSPPPHPNPPAQPADYQKSMALAPLQAVSKQT